ncbi:ParB/RepB/Spo0J family partition protein [Erythrobacter sp. SCSIO 43205]|uniref:ParB/RepB/Spo0J family partition protein n=1 Tax=Erythrobacter sp. SCSIO 43205 TaxID=2779361 RepID=UPI001CA8AC4B|nr:ParB/RepB/Spo0J family partition protein [Erythrobacter sp. SCSIO 43205]UAB78478.1 ParB/RepB/Spo0J family partition protein [Erythrobacter sp. SCSIO 43205]
MSGKSTDSIQFTVPQRKAADRKKKLGKGLGALLGETKREEPLVTQGGTGNASGASDRQGAGPSEQSAAQSGGGLPAGSPLKSLPIASISPLPGNPRKHFDETALEELAASIAARGVIQPIIVRPKSNGKYELVAGERRWRAAQKARLHEMPALVRELSDREVMALALIENLQREDLNPVEEARAYQRLAEDEGMTQAEIARMVEKSRSHVANIQRLLGLPEAVLDLVEAGKLSMGHARALVGNDDAAALAEKAVNDNLSVREIEKLVRKVAKQIGATKETSNPLPASGEDADIVAVQRHLEEFLGLKVRIKSDSDPRSGEISIRYGSLDQLDLVCQRLTGGDF